MSNPQKRKGDKAELEVQALLRTLLGVPARRALGAGRLDDVGDIDGVPDTAVSVANYADLARAVRDKLPDLLEQQERRGTRYGAMFCRRRGGRYVVVQTPEQFAALWLAGQAMADRYAGMRAPAVPDTPPHHLAPPKSGAEEV